MLSGLGPCKSLAHRYVCSDTVPLPYEVAESQYENTNAGELHHIGEASIERLHKLRKHRSEREWSESEEAYVST